MRAMLRSLIQWLMNDPRFTEILRLLETIIQELQEMSDSLSREIETLTQNVARLTNVNASAEALLKGLHDQIDAELATAQNAGVDPAALQRLHDLNSQIAAQTGALASAVEQNTASATNQGGAAPTSGDTGATAAPGGDTAPTG
jgi:uncharacterized phage infection (PIP) family protein YhgE